MCVIMVIGNTRPSDEMVKRAFEHNKDGAGIAWREKDEVVWKKGIMQIDEIMALIKKVPTPAIAHFRVASVGGVRKSLTHPFLINKSAKLQLEGRTKEDLLFHNGHWTPWDDKALDAAIAANVPIPEGEWSDTRAIAWLVSIYGIGFMELLTQQKGVIFGPNKLKVFTGRDGWDKINDVWCSNDYFWKGSGRSSNAYSRLCRTTTCSEKAEAGKDYCSKCESKRNQEVTVDADKEEPQVSASTKGTKVASVSPLVKLVSLDQAERIHRMGGMSGKKIKKFRKHWENMKDLSTPQSKRDRAMKELQYLSQQVGETLLTGSVN